MGAVVVSTGPCHFMSFLLATQALQPAQRLAAVVQTMRDSPASAAAQVQGCRDIYNKAVSDAAANVDSAAAPPEVRRVVEMCRAAIQVGAPAFNAGNHARCRDVYIGAVREGIAALDWDATPALVTERRQLLAAVGKALQEQSVTAAAWTMRHALDHCIAGSTSCSLHCSNMLDIMAMSGERSDLIEKLRSNSLSCLTSCNVHDALMSSLCTYVKTITRRFRCGRTRRSAVVMRCVIVVLFKCVSLISKGWPMFITAGACDERNLLCCCACLFDCKICMFSCQVSQI